MKIAVEARVLTREPKSGVHYYVQRLLAAAAAAHPSDRYELVYLGKTARSLGELGLSPEQFRLHPVRWFPRRLYNLLLRTPIKLPIDLLAGVKADLFVFPAFARWPLLRPTPSVVIIYDTVHLDYPSAIQTRHFRWYLGRAIPRSLKRATTIITISQSTRESLIRNYHVDPAKVSVIVPAIDHDRFKPVNDAAAAKTLANYNIKRKYILHLATIEPRKNTTRVIEAYHALPAELRAEYQLVLAGARGWRDTKTQAAAAQLAESELVMTGFVEEADLPALYSGAQAFVYPSLYEGWGMPILEAMACGAPVITATNSSLPEAGGSAAAYVDALDTTQLAQTLTAVLGSKSTQERMRRAGLTHAAAFTWRKSAEQLHHLFEETINQ